MRIREARAAKNVVPKSSVNLLHLVHPISSNLFLNHPRIYHLV